MIMVGVSDISIVRPIGPTVGADPIAQIGHGQFFAAGREFFGGIGPVYGAARGVEEVILPLRDGLTIIRKK